MQRLAFRNVGPDQNASVVVAHLDGRGYPGAAFTGVRYFINVDKVAHTVRIDADKARRYRLHPAHRSDPRALAARYDVTTGAFSIPARTAVVFVE